MRRLSLLLAIAGACVATAAAGQDTRVPIPTGDGGRYVKLIDSKARVAGYAPAAVQAFRGRVDAVLAQLDAMPQVNTPPSGLCHQLESWIGLSGAPEARVLTGSVGVMRPLDYRNGRCGKTNNGLVMLGLNQASDLLGRAPTVAGEGDESWYVLSSDALTAGRFETVQNGQRIVVLTRPATPLFVAVSAERYLAEQVRRAEAVARQSGEDRITEADLERWRREERPRRAAEAEAAVRQMAGSLPADQIAQMRATNAEMLAAAEQALVDQLQMQREMDARAPATDPRLAEWRRQLAQVRGRGAPACVRDDAPDSLDLSGACRSGQQVVALNPAYYDARRPGDVQLITVVTPVRGDNGSEPSRQALWSALDLDRLAALVR